MGMRGWGWGCGVGACMGAGGLSSTVWLNARPIAPAAAAFSGRWLQACGAHPAPTCTLKMNRRSWSVPPKSMEISTSTGGRNLGGCVVDAGQQAAGALSPAGSEHVWGQASAAFLRARSSGHASRDACASQLARAPVQELGPRLDAAVGGGARRQRGGLRHQPGVGLGACTVVCGGGLRGGAGCQGQAASLGAPGRLLQR